MTHPPPKEPAASRLKDRLKLARSLRKLTQTQVALAAGITQPAYNYLEREDPESSANLAQLADALRVNATWLATGKGPMERESAASQAQKKNAIVYAYNPDGPASESDDCLILSAWKLERLGNPDPSKLLMHYAADASMAPAIQEDGLVLIDTSRTKLEPGKIYLLNIGGTPYLRRLIDDYGRWKLKADAINDGGKHLDELTATVIGQVI